MKKRSICHLPFSIFSCLSDFCTVRGKITRVSCNFLLAAKLKTKSSNNSSIAFGVGASTINCYNESIGMESTLSATESVAGSSALCVLFPVQENISRTLAIIAIRNLFIIKVITCQTSLFSQNLGQNYKIIMNYALLIMNYFVPLHANLQI